MNTEFLNSFVEYWKTSYNWTERQAYINSYPHYKTKIGGLKIHFLHVKPDAAKAKGKKVLPLLLIHGWPGSVIEFYKIIPLLTSPRQNEDFVFEVISPSLPGYGFSEAASKPGMGPAHMGAIFLQLMERLGYSNFYVQGGDWGAVIGKSMSILYPKRVRAYHSNFCLSETLSSNYRMLLSYLLPSFYMEESKIERFREQFVDTYLLEMGYMHIQATKPDTVGVALTDSPVGLAAYILEKFSTWTNRSFRKLTDGGLGVYSKDELIDNLMIYWLTNSITTSVRLYSEYFNRNYYSLGIKRVRAYHSNFCLSETLSSNYRMLLSYLLPSFYMEESKIERFREQFVDTYLLEMGYMHIQATKPDTVGVALTDSPVGLAAYILEKFSTWTNRSFRKLTDGGLGVYSKDELIDNLMIYWLTNSITTSVRLYSEYFNRNYYSLGIKRVRAYHSNFCLSETLSSNYRMLLSYLLPSFYMEESKIERFREQFVDTYLLEMGYMHIQATKPDTVGVALTDSPVGLAAYILEKFSTWTNRSFRKLTDGGLGVYSKDELIDNLMIYWLTNSITTSVRLYSEYFNRNYYSLGIKRHPVRVPTGCAQFPQEIMYYPKTVVEGTYHNLIHYTEMPKGGHFGAFEQPQLLADEIWKFMKIVLSMPKKK